MNSKIDIRNKIDALKQTISLVEEVKDQVKLRIKRYKKIKNSPTENPFDFTEYVKGQKEDDEMDLGLFLELAEESKIIYNRVPVNFLIEDMEKLKNLFFTNSYISPGDDREIETKRFFEDCDELAKLIDKNIDKYVYHPSIYYTGNIYWFFRNFKRVNRSEHGRDANELNSILEYEGENC